MTKDDASITVETNGEAATADSENCGNHQHDERTKASSKFENERLDSKLRAVDLRSNGLLHLWGHAVVPGIASDKYGLTKNRLLLSSESPNEKDCWYPLATLNDPSLNKRIGQNDNVDYSYGAITTLNESGIELSTLPPGRYTAGLSVERAEGVFELTSVEAPVHEQWTLSKDSIIGSTSDGQHWKLYNIPLPGRLISDAYFQLVELEIRQSRLHVQGYFVPNGKDFSTWDSIDYVLSLIPADCNAPQVSMKLANGNRANIGKLTGEAWRDQSKAYFATREYAGLDLTDLVPGEYELWISGRAGDDVFSRSLSKTLSVTSNSIEYTRTLPGVSIIGSCVTRDNFNSSISPYWKSLWKLNSTFYQSSIVSLMSEPVNVSAEFLQGLNKHDKEVVTRDLSKSFLEELELSNPEILIVDLFADTRFGVIEIGNSWITNNEWKLPNANGYESISANEKLNGTINKDKFIGLFDEKCNALKSFLLERLPKTTVCLNAARTVQIQRGVNTEGGRFSREQMDRLNRLWTELDEIFTHIMSPAVLESMPDDIQADAYHQWGPGPVHYEKRFYSEFHAKLRKQAAMETRYVLVN